MGRYAIIAKPRYDKAGFLVPYEFSTANVATEEAMRIFREGTMHQVLVINEGLGVEFKQTRRCLCKNVQQELQQDGTTALVCMECKLVINYDGWMAGSPIADEVLEGDAIDGEESDAVAETERDEGVASQEVEYQGGGVTTLR